MRKESEQLVNQFPRIQEEYTLFTLAATGRFIAYESELKLHCNRRDLKQAFKEFVHCTTHNFAELLVLEQFYPESTSHLYYMSIANVYIGLIHADDFARMTNKDIKEFVKPG